MRWKRTIDEDLNDLTHRSEEFAGLLHVLQARDSHRRDQIGELATVIQDLQGTCRSLQRRMEQVEAESHGHCRGCGAVTDYPTITACQKLTCTKDAA